MQSSVLRHQQLYQNVRGQSSHWKDKLREKCLERARLSRSHVLEKKRQDGNSSYCRQMAMSIVSGELDDVLQSHHNSKIKKDEQEILLDILDEVQNELTLSELMVEDRIRFEEADLAWLVNMGLGPEVICPVCQVRSLEQQYHVQAGASPAPSPSPGRSRPAITCPCGVSLPDTSLSAVSRNLEHTLQLHSKDCQHTLQFASTAAPAYAWQSNSFPLEEMDSLPPAAAPAQTVEPALLSNVLVTCPCCDWMSFLI